MNRALRITRRTRLRLVMLAVLSLFFQQMALASYLCSPVDMPTGSTAMSMHCQGMPMAQRQAPAKAASALCVQHCSHQVASTQDVNLPNVPPLLLPAMLPAAPAWVALPVIRTVRARAAMRRAPGLPPALRYRVLLI